MRARGPALLLCLALQFSCALLGYDFDKNAPGTEGDTTSSSTGVGGDGPVSCDSVADCPGDDNGCALRGCIDHLCSVSFTPAGTPVGTQPAGDCKRQVCDGKGQPTIEDDDADAPIDGNQCTSDACVDGVPGNPPAPDGTSCGVGLTCKNGRCAGCNTPDQCGEARPCSGWTCPSGVCVPEPLNEGSRCDDCKTCQGGGCLAAPVGTGDLQACPIAGDPCGEDGTCDGVGGCRKAIPGVPCSQPVCIGDDEQSAFLCDGAGSCVDQGTELCAPYACSPSTGTCPGSCTLLEDCADSFYCAPSTQCEDCLSCADWLAAPSSSTPMCPPGETVSEALRAQLVVCACSLCGVDCQDVLCGVPGNPTFQCTTCISTNCSADKDACIADVGAH